MNKGRGITSSARVSAFHAQRCSLIRVLEPDGDCQGPSRMTYDRQTTHPRSSALQRLAGQIAVVTGPAGVPGEVSPACSERRERPSTSRAGACVERRRHWGAGDDRGYRGGDYGTRWNRHPGAGGSHWRCPGACLLRAGNNRRKKEHSAHGISESAFVRLTSRTRRSVLSDCRAPAIYAPPWEA